MFTRYLSFVLGGVLVVFAIYHWLLVSGLTSELRAKETQLAQQTERLDSLQAEQATLTKSAADYTKSVAEYKSQIDNQANELSRLQSAQEDAGKRLQLATADAERRASQCAKRPPTIQIIKEADAKCAALKRTLDLYITQRQRPQGTPDPHGR